MFLMRWECAAMASRVYDKNARLVEGGRFATESPGRHSVAGRIGRGTKPPPQFGQTLKSTLLTQSAQNVHSYEQMRAIVDAGGRSLSQHSQFGRSSSAILSPFSLRLDLVEFGQRSFEFVIEEPHRIENFAEGCRRFCPVGLSKGEDAVVAQKSHDRRVGNFICGEVA
jgi:hypothetical protein